MLANSLISTGGGMEGGVSPRAMSDPFNDAGGAHHDHDDDDKVTAILTWRDVVVTSRDVRGNTRVILRGVSGFARPREMLAVMGPSGCGKSTLLDSVAGRLGRGVHLQGKILLNGHRTSLSYGVAAYVTQDDILVGTLSVRETLTYAALLRLPFSMSRAEKLGRVDGVLSELGLMDAQHTRIGGFLIKGVSGGQKRRVSIGCELVTQPRILFLDEPTSGLDAASAFFVMDTVRRLARRNRTVLAVVHQPSGEVFDLFDGLCLLSNGRVVFFGRSSDAMGMFERAGLPCPSHRSPTDHYLHVINMDFTSKKKDDKVEEKEEAEDEFDERAAALEVMKDHKAVLGKREDSRGMTEGVERDGDAALWNGEARVAWISDNAHQHQQQQPQHVAISMMQFHRHVSDVAVHAQGPQPVAESTTMEGNGGSGSASPSASSAVQLSHVVVSNSSTTGMANAGGSRPNSGQSQSRSVVVSTGPGSDKGGLGDGSRNGFTRATTPPVPAPSATAVALEEGKVGLDLRAIHASNKVAPGTGAVVAQEPSSPVAMDVEANIEALLNTYRTTVLPGVLAELDSLEFPAPKAFKCDACQESVAKWFAQTITLTRRMVLNNWRNAAVFWLRLGMYVMLCICVGTIYLKLGRRWADTYSRASLVFFVVAFLTFMAIAGFPAFVEDMQIFMRERLNGYYAVSTFAISNTIASTPFIFGIALVSSCVVYWLVKLNDDGDRFPFFLLNLFASLATVESLMVAIAAVVPHYLMGIAAGAGIMGLFMLVCGFFQPVQQLPAPIWRYPLHYMGYHSYAFAGFMRNEFAGTTDWGCACSDPTTCDPTCRVTGETVLKYWSVMSLNKWVDFIIQLCMMVLYRIFFWAALTAKEKMR